MYSWPFLSPNLSAVITYVASSLSSAPQNTLYPCIYLSYWREGTRMQAVSFNSPGPETQQIRLGLGGGFWICWASWYLCFALPTILQRLHLHWLRKRLDVTCDQDQEGGPFWQPSVLFCCLKAFCSLPNFPPKRIQAKVLNSTVSIQPRRCWDSPIAAGCGEGLSHGTQPLGPHPSWKGLVCFLYFPFIGKLLYNATFLHFFPLGVMKPPSERVPLSCISTSFLIRSWVSLVFVDWMLNMIWIEPEQQVAWETLHLSIHET